MPDDWTELPMEHYSAWRAVLNGMAEAHELTRPAACPLCGTGTLHLAFGLWGPGTPRTVGGEPYLGAGRHWEWCDNCLAHDYSCNDLVPAWAGPSLIPPTVGTRDPSEVIPHLAAPGA
ncbi:hypothetical protein ACIRBX_21585 [Kitasatospora sp. NPDC096147]|uniref:hypothetical protein n=1 Tax=Kitasatospora sp. NPDC096147 TaxID=3364093 RepID=UPI00380EE569